MTATAPRPSAAEQSMDHHGFEIMSHSTRAKNVSSYDLTAAAEINLLSRFFLSFKSSTTDLIQIHHVLTFYDYTAKLGLFFLPIRNQDI